eukprot:5423442-Ditylum_brightwellii.AAC.1
MADGDDVMEDGSVDDGETEVDDDVTMGDSVNVTVGGNANMMVGDNIDGGDATVGIEGDDDYSYHHDSNLYGQWPDEESISAVNDVPMQETPDVSSVNVHHIIVGVPTQQHINRERLRYNLNSSYEKTMLLYNATTGLLNILCLQRMNERQKEYKNQHEEEGTTFCPDDTIKKCYYDWKYATIVTLDYCWMICFNSRKVMK